MLYKQPSNLEDNLEKRYEDDNTILHMVAKYRIGEGYATLAKTIYTLRSLINVKNEDGDTPLHLAAQEGNLDIVIILLGYAESAETYADKDTLFDDTVLTLAAAGGYAHIMLRLLRYEKIKEVADQANRDGYTALHYAVLFYNRDPAMKDVVYKLLKLPGVVDNLLSCRDEYMRTPLWIAINKNNTEVLGVMLLALLRRSQNINDCIEELDLSNRLISCMIKAAIAVQSRCTAAPLRYKNIEFWLFAGVGFEDNYVTNFVNIMNDVIAGCNKLADSDRLSLISRFDQYSQEIDNMAIPGVPSLKTLSAYTVARDLRQLKKRPSSCEIYRECPRELGTLVCTTRRNRLKRLATEG